MVAAQRIADVLWRPHSGPQTRLLTTTCPDVFFGGARGGGKSDGLIAKWLRHAADHGKDARGIVFRRTYPELEQLQQRMESLYPQIGGVWHQSRRTWKFPNGSNLKLRYLKRDQDASHYQGHEYCVGVGTPVLMADGSWKPIESIQVGDRVETLGGPQAVTHTVKPYLAPCVRASVQIDGREITSQIQPVWHPLFSIAGLSSERLPRKGLVVEQSLQLTAAASISNQGFLPCEHQEIRGWVAYSEGDRSGCRAFEGGSQAMQRPHALSFLGALHEPSLRLAVAAQCHEVATQSPLVGRSCESIPQPSPVQRSERLGSLLLPLPAQSVLDSVCLCLPSAGAGALSGWHATQDFPVGYPSDSDSCGEPAPALSEIAQGALPLPVDAGGLSHDLFWDVLDTIPRYSHRFPHRWVHPYTGEEHRLQVDLVAVEVVLQPCGYSLVADLTVENSNNYITWGGLINKNTFCGIDELGNFPSPDPIDKIRATLRSSKGVPVQMVATGNPGGPGQEWINDRYVKPAAPGTPFWDANSRTWRLFLPSLVTDNPSLLVNDPTYLDRLRSSGPPWLVKAWLEGDWNAVQGGDIFKNNWWRYFDLDTFNADDARLIWSWDTAFEKTKIADYSVGMLIAELRNSYYVLAIHRSKLEFPALKRKVKELWDIFPAHAMLVEKKATGAPLIQELRSETTIPIYGINPGADKVARATSVTPLVEQGMVYLPTNAPWLTTFLTETSCFPNAKHDDQVDAFSQGLAWLQRNHRQSRYTYTKR